MWLLAVSVALGAVPDDLENMEDLENIEELDLVDLLDLEVDVATRSPRPLRDAPGIVTLLTHDDLRRAGCRDLADALRLVPALELGQDVWNVTGLFVRGVWAFEGRALLLVDGHDWNETLYGNSPIVNRLPVELIERIEVIRGPGSAMYGGNASLAVIRVTTRAGGSGAEERGTATASWLPSGAFGRQTLSASGASDTDAGRFGIAGAFGRGRKSDGTVDGFGRPADLAAGSRADPGVLLAGWRSDRLDLALAVERYHSTWLSEGEVRNVDFSTLQGRVAYRVPLGARGHVEPSVRAGWRDPWHSTAFVTPESWDWFAFRTDRTLAGVEGEAEPSDWLHVSGGVEGGLDRAHAPKEVPSLWYEGGKRSVTYGMGDAWVQALATTPIATVTAGARYDVRSVIGDAFSPRIALTRAWEHAHAKVLVSRAFRTPGMVRSLDGVRPERSTTLEAEVGVGNDWMYLTGTAFDVRVQDVLIYTWVVDPVTGIGTDSYANRASTGSRGAEVDLVVDSGPARLQLGWAGSTGEGRNVAADFAVPGHPGARTGVPAHKGVGLLSFDLGRHLTLGTSAIVLGPRWAPVTPDPAGPLERLPGSVLWGASANVRDVGVRGLEVGLTAHDLLNARTPYIQAYHEIEPPVPSTGREWLVRISLVR